MNSRKKFSVYLAFILMIAGYSSASGQTVNVTGSLAETQLKRGSSVKGTVVLSIPEGLHVNSNKPDSEYAIPTTVRITGEGFKLGSIDYPSGQNRKFQFSEVDLNVYEGEVTIPFTLTVPRGFRGTSLTVKAVVRYQACTDEVCYPPRNKEITMTAAVR